MSIASSGRVLFIDDDDVVRDLAKTGLENRGYEVEVCSSAEDGLERVRNESFDVVVTDLQLGGMNGLELAAQVRQLAEVPVILVTGQGDLDNAIKAIRAGVYDFLQKPIQMEPFSIAVGRAVENRRLRAEVQSLREVVESRVPKFGELVGDSPAMERVRDLIGRVATADVPVLITGESGTGKELVARALHTGARNATGPFLAINCAALPANLLESELFGHAKGAFTDAKEDKTGLFVQANGGTLFLDEIGEMPIEMQVKLLRALQENKVRPVGGAEEVAFDARVVSATNRDLEEDIEDGRFREDLYYRINVVHMPLPPLRARGSDVLLLAQHFLERATRRSGRDVHGISQEAANRLLRYDWPGNVRELENCMERAVALTEFDQIEVEDLAEKIRGFEPEPDASTAVPELVSVQELERTHIKRVLSATEGNKTKAAEILGFDRRTLYRKLERYGIDV